MPHNVTWLDRLRIERLVWALDQQLYSLPSRSRVAKRREVRANLLTAAHDVGTTRALRRLGTSGQLAEEYLNAELGDGPRHSWLAAACFATSVPLLLNYFLDEAVSAYQQAIAATDTHATGTFTWHGVSFLQDTVIYTFDQGNGSHTGGAWTPLVYVLWLIGTVLCGRLWRLLPWWKHRRARGAAVTA
jgi:hypothetical protein